MKRPKLLALISGVLILMAGSLALVLFPPSVPRAAAAAHKTLVIMEENTSRAGAMAGMPYLSSLAGTYGQATAYYAVAHNSLPNYLSIADGHSYGGNGSITGDCDPGSGCTGTSPSVFGATLAAGGTATAYAEDMTSNCDTSSTGNYAVRHNPWAYYPSESAQCGSHDVPMGSTSSGNLHTAVAGGTLPVTGMMTPNTCNDAHDCSLATADAWLHGWVPVIQSGPDWKAGNLTIIVTFDEDNSGSAGPTTPPGNNVAFVVLDPRLSHKTVSTGTFTHYSLAKWLDDNAGVSETGNAAAAPDLRAAFGLTGTPPTPPPTTPPPTTPPPSPSPTPTPTGITGPIVSMLNTGKCVDDTAGSAANGTRVQLWNCLGNSNQRWTVNPDGTIMSGGKCLDVTGQGTANGTKVELWSCNGGANQQWHQPSAGNWLISKQSGKCLDDPGWNVTNGTRLDIWACVTPRQANEEWVLPTAASPSPSSPGTSEPLGIPGTWKLAFSDEFSGTALDVSKWEPGWFGTGITPPVNSSEQQCYGSSQVTESGGALHLATVARATSCGGSTRPYVSGIVTSNPAELGTGKGFQFTYGAVEYRAYIPPVGGACTNWPALWTDGQNWPADGEMDVYECLGGQASWHLHSGAAGGAADGPGAYLNGYTGWHTFAVDYEPGTATFYYDGHSAGSHAYHVTSPNYLIMNLAVESDIGGANQIPATLSIDYVRVWSRA